MAVFSEEMQGIEFDVSKMPFLQKILFEIIMQIYSKLEMVFSYS